MVAISGDPLLSLDGGVTVVGVVGVVVAVVTVDGAVVVTDAVAFGVGAFPAVAVAVEVDAPCCCACAAAAAAFRSIFFSRSFSFSSRILVLLIRLMRVESPEEMNSPPKDLRFISRFPGDLVCLKKHEN